MSTPSMGERLRARVVAEQVAMLYRIAPFALLLSALGATVVLVLCLLIQPSRAIIFWYVAVNLTYLLRYWLHALYHRFAPPVSAAPRWAWLYVLCSVCAGLAWGALSTPLVPVPAYSYELIFTLATVSVSALGLFSLYPWTPAYIAFVVSIIAPTALVHARQGGGQNQILVSILVAYGVIALLAARRMTMNTVESIKMRFELTAISDERTRTQLAAQAAERATAQFLANMSHELRTPINGILGLTELVLESTLNVDQRRRLQIVQRTGADLLALLSELLDFAKIEAGKVELEFVDFDLRERIAQLVELLSERARRKGLILHVVMPAELPARVCGDSVRFAQILYNLLSNAVHFTAQGSITVEGQIEPSAAADPPDVIRLRFRVIDTGIGIDREQQTRVFNTFAQATSSTTREYGGTGLGLAISKQLVELHGGEIGVHSAPGKGATFWFTLRMRVARSGAAGAAVADSALTPLSGHLLLVEDNPVNQEYAARTLESFGLQVTVVGNGALAVAHFKLRAPDLILMDCQMPLLDGYDATRQIRAFEASSAGSSQASRVPIVAMTAYAMASDRAQCLAAGMDAYLAKPFRGHELYVIVKHWLPQRDSAGVTAVPLSLASVGNPELAVLECSVLDELSALQGYVSLDDLRNLIALFESNAQSLIEAVHHALATDDIEACWRAAHSLRSSAGQLGALRLASLAGDIEAHGRHGRLSDCAVQTPALFAEFSAARAAFKADLVRRASAARKVS